MLNQLEPQVLSAAMFAMTALLLIIAVRFAHSLWGWRAALASILSVGTAVHFMYLAYAGEPGLDLQSTGGISRRSAAAAQDRGEFTHVDEPADATGEGGRGSLLHKALWGKAAARDQDVVLKDCPDCPELVIVRPGYFRMGAPAGDVDAGAAEQPSRVMRIGRPYAIGRHEVTVGQFSAYLAATKTTLAACPVAKDMVARDMSDARLPISCISAVDASGYVKWLSAKTGLIWRLPSEAEWEYAARGGSADRYVTGNILTAGAANVGAGTVAILNDKSARRTEAAHLQPVGSYKANGYGLYDVHGNVAEMTADCWAAFLAGLPGDASPAGARRDCSRRALRDAGAAEAETAARLSARRPIAVDARLANVGFRVVRELR